MKNKTNTKGASRLRWALGLGLAALALGLAVIAGQVSAANETYTLVFTDGVYHVENDPTQTVQMILAPQGWTITGAVTAEQDSYVYNGTLEGAEGNTHYGVPAGGTVTVTMVSPGTLLPVEAPAWSDGTVESSYDGAATTLVFQVTENGLETPMELMAATETALTVPDALGVAQVGEGVWYCRDGAGVFYSMARVRIQTTLNQGALTVSQGDLFAERAGIYGVSFVENPDGTGYQEGYYAGTLRLTLNPWYSHGGQVTAQGVPDLDNMTADAVELTPVAEGNQSFSLDPSPAEAMELQIELNLTRLVGVTEVPDGVGYTLGTESYADPTANGPVTALLTVAPAYSASKPQVTAAGYTVAAQPGSPVTGADGSLEYRYDVTPAGGAYDTAVTEIPLEVTGIGRNITVADRTGTGYTLTMDAPAYQGGTAPILVRMAVDGQYGNIPVITPQTGYTASLREGPSQDGNTLYYTFGIGPENGGAFGTDVTELSIQSVSGLVPVTAAQASGEGYTLTMTQGSTLGSGDPLEVELVLGAEYSASVPGLSLTNPQAGYLIGALDQWENVDGSVGYSYRITPEDGVFPETETVTEFAFSVSGVGRTVTVPQVRGLGYVLSTVTPSSQGSGNAIVLNLLMEEPYTDTVPTLTAESGYTITQQGSGEAVDTGIRYTYHLTPDGGTFPQDKTEVRVAVAGMGEVSVLEYTTIGYEVRTMQPAVEGSASPLGMELAVNVVYEANTPVVTAQGYEVTLTDGPAADGDLLYYRYDILPAGGGAFQPGSGPVAVAVSGVVPVTAAETSGTGYSLTMVRGSTLGSVEPLVIQVTVEAEYSAAAPTLALESPAAGYILGTPERTENQDSSVTYTYQITPEDGVFPETETVTAFTFTVTGVVENVPEAPEIRVENELNRGDHSSNTTLWPRNTGVEDGVSITTVTPEELEAMLELARIRGEEAEKLPGDVLKEGIIFIEGDSSQIKRYELWLTGDQFRALEAGGLDRFTVAAPSGELSLYQDSMTQVVGQNDQRGLVRLILQRQSHEGRPAVDATILVAGEPVTEIEEPYGVRVFLPYTPGAEEDTDALVAVYLPEAGGAEYLSESSYDPDQGGMVLHVGHLSKFGVSYRPTVFTDVGPDHWANPYITFLSSRGVMIGDGSGKFRPEDAITRGEFVVLLAGALSEASMPGQVIQIYADVPVDSYLAKQSNWLYYNNLDKALTDGGKLRPYEAMTREDLAVMLCNISDGIGLRIRSLGLDTAYTDEGDIAGYAKDAVTRLRAAGILDMASNYKFNPKATITRGEVTKIIAMLINAL